MTEQTTTAPLTGNEENTVTIEFADGTVAHWVVTTYDADHIAAWLVSNVGEPDGISG